MWMNLNVKTDDYDEGNALSSTFLTNFYNFRKRLRARRRFEKWNICSKCCRVVISPASRSAATVPRRRTLMKWRWKKRSIDLFRDVVRVVSLRRMVDYFSASLFSFSSSMSLGAVSRCQADSFSFLHVCVTIEVLKYGQRTDTALWSETSDIFPTVFQIFNTVFISSLIDQAFHKRISFPDRSCA